MPEQAVTLEALYAAIEQVLRERLPEAQLIGFWPGVPENTPAVSWKWPSCCPSAIPVPARAPAVPPAGADNGAAWCRSPGGIHCLRNRSDIARATWNLSLEPARFVRSAVDGSREELKSLRVWLVEWTQSLRLGDPEWAWEDQPPGSLMLGFDPQTGPGHEPDYFAPEALA